MSELPKIANDDGKKEIQITFTKFICIGASPPHDHPHVSLEMGKNKQIICPYCGTISVSYTHLTLPTTPYV